MTHQYNQGQSSEPMARRQFSHWLRKHKAMVTITSAFTVLTGFVVKETLDEPAKDRLNAIQRVIRDNNAEQAGLYIQLADINSNLRVLRDKMMGASKWVLRSLGE